MSTLLIANRGEIARRIVRAGHAAGMRVVAVTTAAEAETPYLSEADDVQMLPGEGPAAYLDQTAVIGAARAVDADLVHPGYGFLSENAQFARALAAAGIGFVGPDPATLDAFGDKAAARDLAASLGIPVLGATDPAASPADIARFAADASGPVIVKAVAGGGGRGMRIVHHLADLSDALARASSEAERGFGDGRVYVEHYLPRSRHIEVQLIGDGAHTVHLGTRDCTVQRRHQKVIEIAPAGGLDPALEEALLAHAVTLGDAIRLRGLATVEYLVDLEAPGRYFFIEANPRLQVEHGVTELVTGLDIVRLQLAVAGGSSLADLAIAQTSVAIRGVAIEARVTAGAGRLTVVQWPPPPTRVDTAAHVGMVTGAGFDPLLGKVLVHGADPHVAASRLAAALAEVRIEGAPTDALDVRSLLEDDDVVEGRVSTTYLDDRRRIAPSAELVSEVGGIVVAVAVEAGDVVRPRQPLVVIEAMKMEYELQAPTAGTIQHVLARVGQSVRTGDLLVSMDAEGDPLGAETGARAREDLEENERRHARTLDAARPDAVARRHAAGKRTARENVDDLFVPGSFLEVGGLVIAAQRRRRSVEELEATTPADGAVTGFGEVAGVGPAAVLAYDYTVLAGTQGLQSHKKAERLFELARRRRCPVIVYAEGGGGRPGDTDNDAKATGMDLGTFVSYGRLNGVVPTVAIASGRCFAGTAALVAASDVVIATADANIGMGGPAMVEGGGLGTVRAEEIGPAADLARVGAVDVLVRDEGEATAIARRYLSFFSDGDGDAAVTAPPQAALDDIVPAERRRPFDVRSVISHLVDDDGPLELRAGFAPGIVTALARIEGRAVGIVANDGRHLGGAIDLDGADKMARFLALCDTYGLPVVSLCDTPGFMVGPESEATGAMRHFGRLFSAGPNLSVPLVTVVMRKAWGLGGQIMAGGGFRVPDAIVCWPTAEFGAMGAEGAVRLAYRKELAAIADEAERDAEFERLVAEYVRQGSGGNAASVFEVDDVIAPSQTRRWISTAIGPRRPWRPHRRLDTW